MTPKTRRIVAIIASAVVLLAMLWHFVVTPRINAWMLSKFPVVYAVQTALEAKYPKKSINVSDQTFYSAGSGAEGRQRILGVVVIGDSHIGRDEAKEVKNVICTALGDDAKNYDKIVLQSTIEKRFLIFFSRDNRPGSITC